MMRMQVQMILFVRGERKRRIDIPLILTGSSYREATFPSNNKKTKCTTYAFIQLMLLTAQCGQKGKPVKNPVYSKGVKLKVFIHFQKSTTRINSISSLGPPTRTQQRENFRKDRKGTKTTAIC